MKMSHTTKLRKEQVRKSSGMLHRVVWFTLTDVLEQFTDSIIIQSYLA
jgi:hypothetical protein